MAVLHWQVAYLAADAAQADAFFAALAVPYFLLAVLTPAVTPLVASRLETLSRDPNTARTLQDACWEMMLSLGGGAVVVAILLAAISVALARWLFTGLTPGQLDSV